MAKARFADYYRFYLLGFVAALLGSAAAHAQEHELGLRYWLSTGETSWNHTAGDPVLGDPTSLLRYEKLEAHAAELYFRRFFGARWFVRGDVGIGAITKGSFDDEDFAAGQFKFSDTTSPVEGNSLRYFTLDVGKVIAQGGERRPQLYLFAGYQYWTERYDAYGLTATVDFFGTGNLGGNVPVISNEVRWNSVRLGVGGKYAVGRYTFSADIAYVPYTEVHNRDFHYLRSDLGGVPNVYLNGSGTGWQLDAEVRRALTGSLDLGLGIRYWTLKADGDIDIGGSRQRRLNDIESRRVGITATLAWRY